MKNFTRLRWKVSLLLFFPVLGCQPYNQPFQADLAAQVAGVYRVGQLQVFGQILDTSRDFTGIVILTKTDASHVRLGLDIRHKTGEPMPLETRCRLRQAQSQTQLIEEKTNVVLGYVEHQEIHLHSSDSSGAETKIVGRVEPEN